MICLSMGDSDAISNAAPEVARRFALALDREDYQAAGRLVHPHCVYTIRGEVRVGPDAIIAAYAANGDAAAKLFDEIAYSSEVHAGCGDSAVIRFLDSVTHAGERLDHACEQRVAVDAEGKIVRIEHRDLPGERERLEAFRRRHGL